MSHYLTHLAIAQQQSRPILGMTMHELNSTVFRLVVDAGSGDIFVGGRNRIYRLSKENLDVTDEAINGPSNDSSQCKPEPLECSTKREPKPNDNQILLIKYDAKPSALVLSCGTTDQGMCHIHQIGRLSHGGPKLFGAPSNRLNYIASRSSTTAFFAPSSTGGKVGPNYLYVASASDNRPMELSPPVVSAKKMVVKGATASFNYATQELGAVSFFDFKPSVKEFFQVKYLYGFHHGGYAYFVSTQQVGTKNPSDYETRLIRICLDDPTFFSYTELPLQCETKDENVFNYATAAYFGKLGDNQKDKAHVSAATLFIAFSASIQNRGRNLDQTKGAIVCAFPMEAVEDLYESEIKTCFASGENSRVKLLETANITKHKCTAGTYEPSDLCGSGKNPYIEASQPLFGVPYSQFSKKVLTALAVTVQNQETVVVVGTNEGRIIKTSLKDEKHLFVYNVAATSEEDKQIRPDPVFSPSEDFLYLATGKTVIKFPVGSCSIYTDCGSCLENQDPLNCGWCDGRCGHAGECKREPNRNECSPEILDFHPAKGPTVGGTELTILGDNFGNVHQGENSVASVEVAGFPCQITKREKGEIRCLAGNVTGPLEGKIKVHVKDTSRSHGLYDIKGTIESVRRYAYLVPSFESISPTFGPESGGSSLYIKGTNLDIGKNRTVVVNEVPCIEKANNGSVLTCITGRAEADKTNGLVVQIDSVILTLPPGAPIFSYKRDPKIVEFTPKMTIASGHTRITVSGANLDSVADPKLVVTFRSQLGSEKVVRKMPCTVAEDGQSMSCPTPSLPTDAGSIKPLLEEPKNTIYYEDPVIELTGVDVIEDYGVTVRVGNRSCSVEPQGSINKLRCKLSFDDEAAPVENDLLPVQVKVGNQSHYIGFVGFTHAPPSTSSSGFSFAFIIIPLIILPLILYFVYKRSKFSKKRSSSLQVRFSPGSVASSDYSSGHQLSNDYSHGNRADGDSRLPLIGRDRGAFVMDEETLAILISEQKLIAREYLTLKEQVGKGHFGCVYKAALQLPGTDEYVQVAVKTLQSSWVTQSDVEMFIKEALIMKDFDHEHVLNLIGVSFSPDDGSPMVIIPFMPNGDLLKYIRDEHNQPNILQLLTFGIEIAKGMEYLSNQKFVHRDLAARNCILDQHLRIKVADFGLSRDVYEREYYKSEKKTELPVKWMAPESMEKNSYNMKTDVWSYGVTIWEVITRGEFPYHLVANWQMLQYLKEDFRLQQPEYCPDPLYDIMLQCWSMNPDDRPTFSELVTKVQDVVMQLKDEAKQRRVSRNITYVNLNQQYYNTNAIGLPSTSKQMSSEV
ncbi:Hepatocyte growth factor receptor [Halotydeus destructor]|nr:Hepatocyte growth factor receptor [Halotydeus destructor]